MKRNLTILFLLAGFTVMAQTRPASKPAVLPESAPASVGMSAERLAQIDAMCSNAVAEGEVPGIVAFVSRHGKTVYHKAFGM